MNQSYHIEQRADGDHWISLERLRDSIRYQRRTGQLSDYQRECLMMAATLVDALLLEVGVERVDETVEFTRQ